MCSEGAHLKLVPHLRGTNVLTPNYTPRNTLNYLEISQAISNDVTYTPKGKLFTSRGAGDVIQNGLRDFEMIYMHDSQRNIKEYHI